jgi:hypothetical protein
MNQAYTTHYGEVREALGRVVESPPSRLVREALGRLEAYGRDRPWALAVWALGIGLVVGWRIRRR